LANRNALKTYTLSFQADAVEAFTQRYGPTEEALVAEGKELEQIAAQHWRYTQGAKPEEAKKILAKLNNKEPTDSEVKALVASLSAMAEAVKPQADAATKAMAVIKENLKQLRSQRAQVGRDWETLAKEKIEKFGVFTAEGTEAKAA
jgi:flagellin-like hook-associated protein FlgL